MVLSSTQQAYPMARITVGIPTYARGTKVLQTLKKISECDPVPAEIIVHVDASDGKLEQAITEAFPSVRLISSPVRVGPGGGRHRCLMNATQPYFVSFDDDSWPVDSDFFCKVENCFNEQKKLSVISTVISHRNEAVPIAVKNVIKTVEYTGCGHAMRVAAYREVPGYIDRPWAYGLEERDVGLQLHATGWNMILCRDLRVFHDTVLSHHSQAEITTATIENAALFVWLRYPIRLWPYGLAQYLNVLRFMLRSKRFAGILTGIARTPVVMWRYRNSRNKICAKSVRTYLNSRRISSTVNTQ